MSRHSTAPRDRPVQLVSGAGAGLLAGVTAVAVSEAVAAVLAGVTSPVLSVANRAVDAAPRPLKEFAIETFGTADKPVLIGSVIATVAGLAVVAGILGVRRPRLAVGLFLVLSAVATVAALTDRSATAGAGARLVPAAALVVVGTVSLLALLRPLRLPSAAPDTVPAPEAEPPAPGIETREVLDSSKPRLLVRDLLPGHVAGDDLPAAFDRRAFLKAAAAVGAVAGAGGLVSKQYGGAAAGEASGLVVCRPPRPAPTSRSPHRPSGRPRCRVAPPSTSRASRRT